VEGSLGTVDEAFGSLLFETEICDSCRDPRFVQPVPEKLRKRVVQVERRAFGFETEPTTYETPLDHSLVNVVFANPEPHIVIVEFHGKGAVFERHPR